MRAYKVGIVGYGVVGIGIHKLFKEAVTAIYDPVTGTSKKSDFNDLDLVVICVPTNAKKTGEADTSIVWDSLLWLSDVIRKDTVILIKSTTPPNQLREMTKLYKHLVFSPEYMGESSYFTPFWQYPDPEDMKMHTWQTFGGKPKDTSRCIDIFIKAMGPHVKFHQTDIVTAGLAKYIENSFFAMKVTFCNEFYDIAKAHGVNYNELRELWLADPRICPMHTAVFPKDRGYGGKCFPKDTKAIIFESEKAGNKPSLMKMMDCVNTRFRKQSAKQNRK